MKSFRITVTTPQGQHCYRAIGRRKVDVLLGAMELFDNATRFDARQV